MPELREKSFDAESMCFICLETADKLKGGVVKHCDVCVGNRHVCFDCLRTYMRYLQPKYHSAIQAKAEAKQGVACAKQAIAKALLNWNPRRHGVLKDPDTTQDTTAACKFIEEHDPYTAKRIIVLVAERDEYESNLVKADNDIKRVKSCSTCLTASAQRLKIIASW